MRTEQLRVKHKQQEPFSFSGLGTFGLKSVKTGYDFLTNKYFSFGANDTTELAGYVQQLLIKLREYLLFFNKKFIFI